jgi:hypothetical protein
MGYGIVLSSWVGGDLEFTVYITAGGNVLSVSLTSLSSYVGGKINFIYHHRHALCQDTKSTSEFFIPNPLLLIPLKYPMSSMIDLEPGLHVADSFKFISLGHQTNTVTDYTELEFLIHFDGPS